jgi:hypothetical protein
MPPQVAIAKFAVNAAIQSVVHVHVADMIGKRFIIDTTAKKVGATVTAASTGFIVAGVASSFIDPKIDKIAAWKSARKAAKTTAE